MNANGQFNSGTPRREAATRRAFYLWIAAYAAALAMIAVIHSIGGLSGSTVDIHGVRTQQARVIEGPQSSIADRELPQTVRLDVRG